MYVVIKGNKTLGYSESPNFIEMLDNGCYGLSNYDKATGIHFKGVGYNLTGRIPISPDLDYVTLLILDGGDVVTDVCNNADELSDATCELAISIEERLGEIEDAVCELAIAKMAGGE